MKYIFSLLIFIICGCSSTKNSYPDGFYRVTKIKKKANDVFFIYAKRNDSIFKIYTHYDGLRKPKSVKLKRGSRFYAPLESFNMMNIKYFNLASWAEVTGFEYYKVIVDKEPEKGINDIYSCDSINGIYYSNSLFDFKVK